MGLFSRLKGGRRKGGASASTGPIGGDAGQVRRHLAEFASTRDGLEAYIEPATTVTPTTLLLVAQLSLRGHSNSVVYLRRIRCELASCTRGAGTRANGWRCVGRLILRNGRRNPRARNLSGLPKRGPAAYGFVTVS